MRPRSVIFFTLMLCSCGGSDASPSQPAPISSPSPSPSPSPTTSPSPSPGGWFKPTAGLTWQWQLNGTLNTSYDVAIFDIDLFDTPTATIASLQSRNIRVICYFSAGSWENFRTDADQFSSAELGRTFPDFPDERWLDIRSANVRRIMQDRLDLARVKGCDGVEPDNVDGFDNSTGFALTAADQLSYNRFLAEEAHKRGLAVGLKNDLAQIPQLVDDFDFAVNEQCFEFSECEELAPFIAANKPVLHAEYDSRFRNNPAERAKLCAQSIALGLSTLILPVDLNDEFRFTC